jgi:hypothetical protein
LDYFKIEAAIAGNRLVPFEYLGLSALYACLYSTFAILLALLLFEDRDLA